MMPRRHASIAFAGGLECNDHQRNLERTRPRPRKARRTWCCCTAAARRGPSASPPAGRKSARFRRSSSSRTGPGTPRPRPSGATTRCSQTMPKGVIIFPGSGITENLADKAKRPRHPRLAVRRAVVAARSIKTQPRPASNAATIHSRARAADPSRFSQGLTPSTRKGSATQACGPSATAFRVIAARA